MNQYFSIPAVYCPFPSLINPYADKLNIHILNWVKRFSLVNDDKGQRRLQLSKFGCLAARAYPHAPLERLEIVSDWNTWLFVLDDQCDEWGLGKNPRRLTDLHERCLAILSGTEPDENDVALAHALYDIRSRIQALMPLSWLTRFIHSVAEYFESTEWEAENRYKNYWPEAETYIRMRPYTGGLLTDIDMIELTESISLPLAVRKHPCIEELIGITNNVVCWCNDLFSFLKEQKHQDKHNLVLMIAHHQSISVQEAIDEVNVRIEKQIRRFLTLEQSLPTFGSDVDGDVQRLVDVMRAWMRGNLDWSLESGRYFSPGEKTTLLGRSTMKDDESKTVSV